MDLSLPALKAWKLAGMEAACGMHAFIEPEHVLIGLCSLRKNIEEESPDVVALLCKESEEIEALFAAQEIQADEVRRSARGRMGLGDSRSGDSTIHRSESCKALFKRAEELAMRAESAEVGSVHLLAALMECPGKAIEGALSELGVRAACILEAVFSRPSLWLARPNRHRLLNEKVALDLEVAPVINLSLAHCGIPLISRLILRNHGLERSPSGRLVISVPGFGRTSGIPVPSLAAKQSEEVSPPQFEYDERALVSQTERVQQTLSVALDGEPLQGSLVTCWVLAPNECSLMEDPRHRMSLATFVLSDHPAVKKLTIEACWDLPVDIEADAILEALYLHLWDQWQIAYRFEAPCWERKSQKVRFPHEVLSDFANRRGLGTCLDLALLLAAALEHLGQRPLIAVLDEGGCRHALVGCRRDHAASAGALRFLCDGLLSDALWADPTGLTRDPRYRATFVESKATAENSLRSGRLVHAIDVAEARFEHGIRPLPLSGVPGWSADARKAIEAARDCAAENRTRLSTVPLLIGLLRISGGCASKILSSIVGDLDDKIPHLTRGLPSEAEEKPTLNYLRVTDFAELFAKGEGSPVVLERHLLRALLETPSKALDGALRGLGCSREDLRHAYRAEFSGSSDSSSFSGLPREEKG